MIKQKEANTSSLKTVRLGWRQEPTMPNLFSRVIGHQAGMLNHFPTYHLWVVHQPLKHRSSKVKCHHEPLLTAPLWMICSCKDLASQYQVSRSERALTALVNRDRSKQGEITYMILGSRQIRHKTQRLIFFQLGILTKKRFNEKGGKSVDLMPEVSGLH